jgi:hypothetical protein
MDTNPFLWGQRSQKSDSSITLGKFLEHTIAFINAYLMIHQQNKLAVIANHVHQR